MLTSGVSIGLLWSSIGDVVMYTLGLITNLVLFFAAGFYFLTTGKVQHHPNNKSRTTHLYFLLREHLLLASIRN
jgi:hypothetical protein